MITGVKNMISHSISFTARDCNDGDWITLINAMKKELPDFQVYYEDGDDMRFTWISEDKKNC